VLHAVAVFLARSADIAMGVPPYRGVLAPWVLHRILRPWETSMFGRIANLFKGFLSLFISGVERRNPEALLEVEKENLRKQISQYNQGLASHAGLCERLMGQVKKLESEERDLRAKTAAHLRAGSREAAGQYALRLQTVSRELEENRTQLQQAEETYKNLMKSRDVAITAAKAKMESLKGAIEDMKMKKAMAEMTEMASGMISEIGGAGDTLNRLHEMVEDERTKAAGRARVARDSMDMNQVNIKEAEQKALADMALADFAAKEGMALDAPAPAAGQPATSQAAPKSMGPQAG
jgi:phage shock protein A